MIKEIEKHIHTVKEITLPGLEGSLSVTMNNKTVTTIYFKSPNKNKSFSLSNNEKELGNFILLMKEFIIKEEL